jgi:energy-coupling factor transporter ATP-binding protein EcfA2
MKKTKQINPFSYQRWEDDKEHLFWLPPIFSEKMEENICVYITGSRGTGKTTLLKALDYKERLDSKSLREQLGIKEHEDYFRKGYIGLYFSTLDYINKNMFVLNKNSNIIEENDKFKYGILFSHFIEYLAIYYLIDALQKLAIDNHLIYSPDEEQKIVSELINERKEIKDYLSIEHNKNLIHLDDIQKSIQNIYGDIWNSFYQNDYKFKNGWNPVETPIGSILNGLVKILMQLSGEKSNKLKLKICFDSFESFNDIQIKAINSLVATKNEYLSFIVASSNDFVDFKSTFIPEHPLTDDDRKIIRLRDYYSDGNSKIFRQLVNEVTKLRFKKHFKIATLEDTDLNNILGKYTINELLEKEFEKTTNPKYKNYDEYVRNDFSVQWDLFLKYRDQKGDENIKKSNEIEITNIDNVDDEFDFEMAKGIPYTHAYITELFNINLIGFKDNSHEINAILKSNYDKKIVGSMLCLCKDKKFGPNLTVPYGGSNMIIQMSDCSVRDFLRQMSEIYQISPKQDEDFLQGQVPLTIQRRGIEAASRQKYVELDDALNYKNELKNLIYFIGQYTAKIQSCGKKALEPPERGIIKLNYAKSKSKTTVRNIQQLIKLASNDYYYIQVLKREYYPDSKEIKNEEIRLHRLFAPLYNFSYRGASYGLEIPLEKLLEICSSDSEKTIISEIKDLTDPYCNESQIQLTNWVHYD